MKAKNMMRIGLFGGVSGGNTWQPLRMFSGLGRKNLYGPYFTQPDDITNSEVRQDKLASSEGESVMANSIELKDEWQVNRLALMADGAEDGVVFYTRKAPDSDNPLDGLDRLVGWEQEQEVLSVFAVKDGMVDVVDSSLIEKDCPEVAEALNWVKSP